MSCNWKDHCLSYVCAYFGKDPLKNTYFDGKPVAMKIHHGTFIIWDRRKVWHNTVISKKAEDSDIYGLYTAAKGLGMP
jgi:hypothetical protein